MTTNIHVFYSENTNKIILIDINGFEETVIVNDKGFLYGDFNEVISFITHNKYTYIGEL